MFALRFATLFFVLCTCATTTPPPRRRARHRRPAPAATTPTPPRTAPPTSFYTPAPPLPAQPSVAPPRPVSHALPPEPLTPDPRCLEVTRRNEAELARVLDGACHGAALTTLRESFGACALARGGAWAPEITELRGGDDGGVCRVELRWRATLFHRGGAAEDSGGDSGRVTRALRIVAASDAAQVYTRLAFAATDYDGDGLPEVVVLETTVDHGIDRTTRAAEVYTGAGGSVAPFEATRAMRIVGVMDADDDGRADLVIPAPYAWTEGAECGRTVIHEPLTMLAHALTGGGFSTTDDVAARYLRTVCPGRGAEAVPPPTGEGVDPVGVGVVCRRLWGATPEEALAPVQCERFRAEPSSLCANTTRSLSALEPGECPSHYETWAHAPPPLRIR